MASAAAFNGALNASTRLLTVSPTNRLPLLSIATPDGLHMLSTLGGSRKTEIALACSEVERLTQHQAGGEASRLPAGKRGIILQHSIIAVLATYRLPNLSTATALGPFNVVALVPLLLEKRSA